jgi:hypothetical protein
MAHLIPPKKRGRPKQRAEDTPPTPETEAKLQPDQLTVLLADGVLSPDQERAGRALHALTRAWMRGMSPRSQFEAPTPPNRRKAARSPVDRMTEREERLWLTAYKPWAAAETATLVCRRPRLTALDLVRQVVDDNTAPRDIARRLDLDAGEVTAALKDALDRFISQK